MTTTNRPNSFDALATLSAGGVSGSYYRIDALAGHGLEDAARLPFSIKVLLEAVLRAEDGFLVTADDVKALAAYDPANPPKIEVPFKPARVLLQDFTGVPAVVDLAAMRSAMARLGGDPAKINPIIPVDLVVDHSVQIDRFGTPDSLAFNAEREFERNGERYQFLRWGQQAFRNFKVVPPASGICHQVNLEYLGQVVQQDELDGQPLFYPDTCVGTDSHTPMIGGLGIVGWGVGGIEAEAVMLGQPLYMLAPPVVGVKLSGQLPEGATATDAVLAVTELLRAKGVVGKFVEFFGKGLSGLTVTDRATIANMAPEYGATIGYFPVDERTLEYMGSTGRDPALIELTRAYCEAQGIFRTDDTPDPVFEDAVEFDLGSVQTSLAGPKRPHDRIPLGEMKQSFAASLAAAPADLGFAVAKNERDISIPVALPDDPDAEIGHGSVAIAAITSCTNTSNPTVMLGAGLLAKKAVELGLATKPWVKTSLAPGSTVVTEYLERTGVLPFFEQLGFNVVGYGCTTCIGNSGSLPEAVGQAVDQGGLIVAGVLSGNRNFEGRIHAQVKANYLASPPLVVAYALAGTVDLDLTSDPLGTDRDGNPVFLADIWPSAEEVAALVGEALDPEVFKDRYGGIEDSNAEWNAIPVEGGEIFAWDAESTYIQEPPFFIGMAREPSPIEPIEGAHALALVGDSTTTDHISPAGAISPDSEAAKYLIEQGVEPKDFNSFGSRRGNDRVMTRGTFGNIRLKNLLAPGTEGGWTNHIPSGDVISIFEAAGRYREANIPTVVLAGRDYGMGSSRDWAAKGTNLLGVKAVIAASFERIHRSNLVGMGVLPLELADGQDLESVGLTGHETFAIPVDDEVKPGQRITVTATTADGETRSFETICRLDTPVDVEYYRGGGILQVVLRGFLG